jgi:glycosyltransferase involved in cell wall biosynthesis
VAVPDPSVSVVVAVRDGERYLAEALDDAFRQTLAPLEVIVVDDGSRDRTVDVAREFPVLLLRSEARGASAARNTGLKRARGDVIASLDHDDRWEPDKLEKQVAHLPPGPLAYVLCQLAVFLEPGTTRPGWVRDEYLTEGFPATGASSLLAWRTTFERVGGYDTTLDFGEDADWLLRANHLGASRGFVDEILVRYRIHDANSSHRPDTDQAVLRVLRRAIARRRASTEEEAAGGG